MAARIPTLPAELLNAAWAGADPVGYFRRHAADGKPFSLIFPGLGKVVFFGTKQAAHDVLTAPATSCIAPTPNPIEPIVGKGSLILLSGGEHRRERARLMSAFHGDRVKTYADIIGSATSDEIAQLQPGDKIDARELAVAIALHVAVRVVFSVSDTNRRDQYTQAIKALMAANTAPLMLLPALRKELGGRGPWARLLRLRNDLDGLLTGDMAERSRQEAPFDDMLTLLLSATDEDGQGHTEEQIHDQLRTLLAAGHETSATSLAWALYHIYRDDSLRARLNSELATCSAPSDMVTLPYLDAVIKETLRMHPPVPIVLRRFTEPLVVDGFTCGEGEIAGIALYALHFNPELWPDPDRFDPERFLQQRVSPFEFAPFGGGYRRCIGASFASSELAVAVGTIMSNLDLRMPEVERTRRPPRSTARGIAVAPSRRIQLDVVDRR